MAKPKRQPPRPAKKSSWVRTGGAVGDDSMDEMNKFIEDGCGVSEEVSDVGCMPNDPVMRPVRRRNIV